MWTKRILAFCLLSATALFGQTTLTSGTIRGTVSDPSGAVIANAKVTVTNKATSSTRQTTTSGSGTYVVADLPPGRYDVSVEAQGFKQGVLKDSMVNVASITDGNIQLQVGSAGEQVTVEAEAVGVQTTSAAVGEIVDSEQATQLPLNGSNFVQLTQIQPGVSGANNFQTTNKGLIGGIDFSVNGNPVTNNLFLIDGANNNDVGSNRTILVYPSIDAIAEFKMLRNSYGPEYGQASGAIVSIATKSGTNQFHGSVNYFGRNDAVSAEDYFAKQANLSRIGSGNPPLPHNGKDELRRNDVIYTIGGPVVKNRLFFFFSQEFNREIQGYTRQACAPTAAELSGDFSGTLSCGATAPTLPAAVQAPGNPLKIASPSPAGLLIASQLPTANGALINGNNWFLSTSSPLNFREENARVDFNVTAGELLTFRYTQDHWDNKSPNLASNGFLWGEDPYPAIEGNWSQPSKSAIAKLTSTLTSTLVNEAQFAYAGNAIVTTPGGTNPGLAAKIEAAMPTIFPSNGKLTGGIPTFWGGAFAPYVANSNIWTIAPYANNMDLYTVRDDLSKVLSNHALKFGAFLSFNAKNENQYGGQDRPLLGSAQGWNVTTATGNALANLLLPGQVFTNIGEQNFNPTDQGRWRDYEFYAGDTWKATPRVTVEYGFRWSFYREPYAANNAFGVFVPSLYDPKTAFVLDASGNKQPNLCDGVTVVPGTTFCQQAAKLTGLPYTNGTPSKYGRSLTPNNNHDIAPRLGVAWDVFGNGKTAIRAGAGQFYQRERVSIQVGLSNSAPFVVSAMSNRTLDALPAASAITFGGGSSNSKILTSNTPNSWQWNAAVEQELARDTALEVAYIGNKGIHLTSIYDLNTVLPQYRTLASADNPTFSTSSGTINMSRPFSSYGQIFAGDRNGWSTYHGLQTLFRTKIPNMLNAQIAYTWSHSISNVDLAASNGLGNNTSNITDPFNPSLDKGNSTINRPNIFVASLVWYLPKLSHSNGFVKGVLGGWEANTITTLENGNSITVYANGSAGTGVGNGIFGTGTAQSDRPLLTGQGCTANTHGSQVLNPNAFTLTGYVIGTDNNPALEPRGFCHAPGLQNVDLGIYKNFKVTERFTLQFRIDAFNALNHVNFRGDQINTDWANNASASCGTDGCGWVRKNGTGPFYLNNTITSSNISAVNSFGQATGDRGPRQFQYGLRLTF